MPERIPAPAHLNFNARRREIASLPLAERFRYIHETNLWGSSESVSGPGSTPEETRRLREELPRLFARWNVRSVLDLPCGDFHWMRDVDLSGISYTGGDLVESLVNANNAQYASELRKFLHLDLTSGGLPSVDLVFCRDCLVHLSNANVFRAVRNLKRSGSRFLLTTTFHQHDGNTDIEDGDWRLLNFEKAPFSWGTPLEIFEEGCTEQDGAFADKSLGLWRISELPEPA